MLLLAAILFGALILGRLFGGSIENLASLKIRWWWLAPIAFGLQVVPLPGGDAAPWISLAALLLSYALLVTLLVCNIRRTGAILMLVGIALNVVVIVANQGMPVSVDAVIASGQANELTNLIDNEDGIKHGILTEDDALPFLADVIPIGPPFRQVASIGDLIFYAGMAWFVVAAMRTPTTGRLEDERPQTLAVGASALPDPFAEP